MGLQLEAGRFLDELVWEADSDEKRDGPVFGPVPLDEVVIEACAVAESPPRGGERHAGQEKQVKRVAACEEVVTPVRGVVWLPDLVLAPRRQGVCLGSRLHREEVETRLLAGERRLLVEDVQLLDPWKEDRLARAEAAVEDGVGVKLVFWQVHVHADGAGALEGREAGQCGGGGGRLGCHLCHVEGPETCSNLFAGLVLQTL